MEIIRCDDSGMLIACFFFSFRVAATPADSPMHAPHVQRNEAVLRKRSINAIKQLQAKIKCFFFWSCSDEQSVWWCWCWQHPQNVGNPQDPTCKNTQTSETCLINECNNDKKEETTFNYYKRVRVKPDKTYGNRQKHALKNTLLSWRIFSFSHLNMNNSSSQVGVTEESRY